MADKQARRWCFTWNNFPDSETKKNRFGKKEEIIDPWKEELKKLKYSYIVCGKEIAPTTGTPHLQGYVEFKSGKRLSTMVKACPGVHFCPANGNANQNFEYCTKCEDWWQDGEISEQGKRMDIQAALEDVKDGMSKINLYETHTMVMFRYPKAMAEYQTLIQKERNKTFKQKEVYVFWGDTGTGKTRSALEFDEDAFIVSESQSGMWWDGYDGETTVIMDEYRCNLPLHILLRVLDGYYYQAPIKGGSVTLNADTIFITSNVSPQEWYKNCDKKSREALFRRICNIIRFDADGSMHEEDVKIKDRERCDPFELNEH